MPTPPSQPSDIAREVLRLFAARRLPPTPDNFRRLYHEVSGLPPPEEAYPEAFLKRVAKRIPRDSPEKTKFARQLEQAVADGQAAAGLQALEDYLAASGAGERPQAWNELIANLLRQWEARQMGWTIARKRESLERVLASGDPATLFARLQALVRSWAQAPSDPEQPTPPTVERATDAAPSPATAAAAPTVVAETRIVASGEAGEIVDALRELLRLVLESIVPIFLAEQPALLGESDRLVQAFRAAGSAEELRMLAVQLRKFSYCLEMAAGDTAEIHAGLLNLLRLLLENIDQIVIDDRWLSGQVETLREIVAKPASVRLIDDAERRLREVIFKQSQLKHNLSQAQKSLREMLAGFVDHLAGFAATTGSYHDHMGRCAEKIAAAQDIAELGDVLAEVMRETRAVQQEARRSRDELQAAQDRARAAEAQVAQMQQQLDEASHLMRHDQLTGALNRRGLEDTFAREAARATRYQQPLTLALLDLDNFKKLNDTFGHKTGDEALLHLATITRQSLRPQDTLARHGGEEFILLFPDTGLDDARVAVTRLQRELTRNFFLTEDKKILITFSAGVTPWQPGESLDSVLKRADGAMYQAKQAGKNKVVAA